MIDDLMKRLRDCANGLGDFKNDLGDFGLCDTAADRIEELEAKLAMAVKGIRTARGFYQVTHIHAALDATLAELTGGNDE